MDESMKNEIEMVKQRDRCEDCVWQGNIDRYGIRDNGENGTFKRTKLDWI